MDEHREELDALACDDADDVREQEAKREYWAEVSVTFQTAEGDAQRCLERSGLTEGASIGETIVALVEWGES